MRKTTYIVLTIHLIAVFWIALMPAMKKENKKPLIVKTIQPKRPTLSAPSLKTTFPTKSAPFSATPQKKGLSPVETKVQPIKKEITKKASPPPTAKRTPIQTSNKPQPRPMEKKATRAQASASPQKKRSDSAPPLEIPAHLLKELEESIAKIEQKPDKKVSKTSELTPKWSGRLNVDKVDISLPSSENYGDSFEQQLILSLHEALQLPEYGMVKMKLTLKSDGSFVRCEVLQAESQKNKSYLEKQIRHVKFPPFSGLLFMNQQQYTFTLTFCNEI